ncbi:TIM-barrel domain-containing protein [Pelistega sp. MC2]|uniref:TIM-barrel domain-containing protein n=1 Tax=Pelistega sp. MC2 TaxID=1720297 RepID=UPI0009F48E2C|nr:TIM-barrel domain-containing protein [Pelistega sp. MC2]
MIQIKKLKLIDHQQGLCLFEIEKDLFLRIEATALGVFRIRCGAKNKIDDSLLNPRAKERQELLLARNELSSEFVIEEHKKNSQWQISHGNTSVELQVNPFAMIFRRDGEVVLKTTDENALIVDTEVDEEAWTINFALPKNDHVYGLGRTAGAYSRRGEELFSDAHDHQYLPFAWSTKGWGLFPNSLKQVRHQVGIKKAPTIYQLQIHDNSLDLFVYIGTVADIFNQFSASLGRPGQPPLSAMGIWLDQIDGESFTDVLEQAEQLDQKGFVVDTINLAPPSVFLFQDDKLTLEWDTERLGDVRQFIADYLKEGKHICVPSWPGVPVGTALFKDLEDRAWLLLDDDGHAYRVSTPYGEVGILDLTYKDAYKFWESRHQQLLDNTDTGINLIDVISIPDHINARQGETGAFLRQLYPLRLEQSMYDAQSYHKIPKEAYLRREALSLNSPRYTGLHLQHSINNFEDIKSLLRLHLTTQASGVISQTHSLLVNTNSSNLYLRFLALSVFSAGFSLVADKQYLPDQFDQKTQEQIKVFFDLRSRLIPYVLGNIEDATRTGLPVQRMMAVAFPDDQKAHKYEYQFLFGPALLVAPILDGGNEVEIYLPEGEAWWDVNTGIRYEGGQVLQYECDVSTIPVFGREGHMLCMGPVLEGLSKFNTARILDQVWLFGMPLYNPVVMRNKIRVMQMQGSSYIKGFEGLDILQSSGLEVKRRGAEVRISRER